MTKGKRDPNKNSYLPSEAVVNYFRDKITLNKRMKKIRDRGRKIPEEIEKENDNLSVRKHDILDEHIFPSMANIVVFFERLSENSELRKLFEDDVKELLGVFREPHDQKKETADNYLYRKDILPRLVESVLAWNMWSEKEDEKNNFRLKLIYSLYDVINKNLKGLIRSDESLATMYKSVFQPDLNRVEALTLLFANRYNTSFESEKDADRLPDRPINF